MARIWLLGKDGDVDQFAIIDDEDYERVARHEWCLNTQGYVRMRIAGNLLLHRFLLNIEDERVVHHENEDLLDNRKRNLRVMTAADHLREHHRRRRNKKLEAAILAELGRAGE